jgi:hypothetical protein
VEASNSCVRTLIFGSVLLLPFVKFFFPAPFSLFLDLAFYCLLIFLFDFFIALCFPPSFSFLFYTFFSHVVSYLAYPNLLENKRLDCCCYLNSFIIWDTYIFLGVQFEQNRLEFYQQFHSSRAPFVYNFRYQHI